MVQTQPTHLHLEANQRLRQVGEAKHFIIESESPCDRWNGTADRVQIP